MRRRLWFSLVSVVLVVVGTLGYVIATGSTPILGLDLQGGVSVILQPVEPASEEDLLVIRDQIRDELERRGIAEPDVRVQGDAIVVDLPGVRDQTAALAAVDVSGVVELRPVVNFSDCPASAPIGPVPGVDDDVTPPADATEPTGFRRPQAPDGTTPDDTTTEDPLADPPIATVPVTTGAELLPTRDGSVLCIGPAQGTGEVFERGSAAATLEQGWGVAVDLRGDGQVVWNNLANQCFNGFPTCPSTQPGLRGQLAIVLDGVVQTAPQVNQPNFTDSVAITGNFSENEARSLASVLNRGAFPVQVEAQEARTISASAGGDSLRAGIIAGLIGLALVLVMMVLYYRTLALVIVAGIVVWAGMVFAMASLVSTWTNFALTLAGVTGIIVSVGVTVDSYIVFFERIKDELRNGRTIKNAAPRSFNLTWRTILSANVVSLIGAFILFWLSVGSVRGFALYLGLTTICGLLVLYFFTRPAVLLLSQSKLVTRRKRLLNMNVATA
jgi:preprotein translocase subunit SecD